VTIVDTVLPRTSGRRHLLWVVVSLSLALNLFFVAGAMWTRFHAPAPLTRAERFDEMAATLALNSQQRQAFAQYSTAMHERLLAMRDAVQPLVRTAWSEVAKPKADETEVMRLLDQATQARSGYLHETTAATIAFLKGLSPQQRTEFIKIIHQGPPPWALQFPPRRD
jgi:uncharacterized membrane protein